MSISEVILNEWIEVRDPTFMTYKNSKAQEITIGTNKYKIFYLNMEFGLVKITDTTGIKVLGVKEFNNNLPMESVAEFFTEKMKEYYIAVLNGNQWSTTGKVVALLEAFKCTTFGIVNGEEVSLQQDGNMKEIGVLSYEDFRRIEKELKIKENDEAAAKERFNQENFPSEEPSRTGSLTMVAEQFVAQHTHSCCTIL